VVSASAWLGPPFDFFSPAELVKVIEDVVPHVVDMLKGNKSWVRESTVTALGELSKQRK